MNAAEILVELGIQARSTSPGRFYAICPKCSHLRKPINRKKRCLGVTIDEQGVKFGCNNCEWTGGKYYDDQRQAPRMVGKPGHRPGAGRSFRSLYG